MRRYNPPFNGNRYVLNKATGEIHDLDNETSLCQIDEMNPDHVSNCVSYEDAKFRAAFFSPHGGMVATTVYDQKITDNPIELWTSMSVALFLAFLPSEAP